MTLKATTTEPRTTKLALFCAQVVSAIPRAETRKKSGSRKYPESLITRLVSQGHLLPIQG